MSNLYPKIPVIFNRTEDGTKRFVYGSFKDESMKFLKDCAWNFYEKIDGTNIRIIWDGHKVSFGGRTDKAVIPKPLLQRLEELFGGQVNEELFEQKFGGSQVVLYGEGFGPGIQKGGDYCKKVDFALFDVKIGQCWLERDSIEDIAKTFGLKTAPFVLKGTIDDAIDYVAKHPKSAFGTAFAEGLVGKPQVTLFDRRGERIICKIKWEDIKDMERA